MNREQARAEALEMLGKLADDTGLGLLVGNERYYCVYRDYADMDCGDFHGSFLFDPLIEAPPKNTIVEVWNDDPGQAMLAFSSGELRDGKLVISWRREPIYNSCFRNWKVIEVAK